MMHRIAGYRNVFLRHVVVGFGMIALLLLGASVVSADWQLFSGTTCKTPGGNFYTGYKPLQVPGVTATDGTGRRGRITVTWTTDTSSRVNGYHVSMSVFDQCLPAYYPIRGKYNSSKKLGTNCQGYRHIYDTPSGRDLSLYVKVRAYRGSGRNVKYGDWSDTVVLDCAAPIDESPN